MFNGKSSNKQKQIVPIKHPDKYRLCSCILTSGCYYCISYV